MHYADVLCLVPKAELYKLNIYSAPSGKFKAHVDTPRSKSQVGSLVVALPVEHKGKAALMILLTSSIDHSSRWQPRCLAPRKGNSIRLVYSKR